MGYIHDYLGNHADSLAYNLKSWKLCTASGNRDGETRLLNNIGYSYYRLGRFEAALEHYRKALGLNGADENLHALLLDNMALAFEKLGNVADALAYQRQSLSFREAQGDKRGVSYSLDSLGSIHKALGEENKAQACLERSLALKKALGDQKGEAETLLLLGGLFLDQEQPSQALPLLQGALAAAVRSGSQDNIYGAHKRLFEAFKRSGRLGRGAGASRALLRGERARG